MNLNKMYISKLYSYNDVLISSREVNCTDCLFAAKVTLSDAHASELITGSNPELTENVFAEPYLNQDVNSKPTLSLFN